MGEMIKLEVEGTLDFRDLLNANYYIIFKKNAINQIVFGVVVGVGGAILYSAFSPTKSVDIMLMSLVVIFLLTLFASGGVIAAYINTKRYYSSNKAIQGPIKYIFTDEGIEISADTGYGFTKWEAVYRVEENSNSFLLYPAKQIIQIIPKRYFNGAVQDAEFRRIVLSKLNSRAKIKALTIDA